MKLKRIISLALAVTVTGAISFGAMTIESPKKSPSTGENDNAKLVDEGGRRIPIIGVIYPDANGATGLNSSNIVAGKVSQVTGKEEPPQYKLTNGKKVPLYALAVVNTGAGTLVPFTVSGNVTGNVTGSASLNVLKAGDTMSGILNMGSNKITNVTNPTSNQDAATKSYTDNKILTFSSSAGSGGAAFETLTVTGILATDTILAVTQKTAGGNNTATTGYSNLANDALKVYYTADPGSGSVVQVTVKR